MKKWYSTNELKGLAGLPKTAQGVAKKAKKEGYIFRSRSGKGGGKEYALASLPDETQDALIQNDKALSVTGGTVINAAENTVSGEAGTLKKWQREIMEARLVLFREFEQLRDVFGTEKAVKKMVTMANNETLPEHLQPLVATANARAGKGRPTLSRSMILGWQRTINKHGITGLAPKGVDRYKTPSWALFFEKVYNRPQKPSLPEAMRELEHILPENIPMPSYYQIRRYHHKRSRLEREKGRHSSGALKRFRGYIRRSTDNLMPLDVVQCDGHSFKAKISHPVHGRPFAPEVCAVIDVKTKMCMGWSCGLAESAHTVADALRHSMTVNDKKPWGGVPAILYTDKGAGNMANMLGDAVVGVLARAGITHHTGIPGNAQGRGLVEKTNQRLWISAARKLDTFTGRGMDALEKRRVYLLMEKEVRSTGTCVISELPSWARFIEFCEQSVRDYNNTPHQGLKKCRDSATGRVRHMTPAEAWFTTIRGGWSPTMLDPGVLSDLFRPQEIRKTTRAQVSLFNKIYYEAALEHYHGENVIVEYDIHDVEYVRIRDMEQRLLCTAQLNRNKRDFFPLTEVERATEKRASGRKKLLERRLDEVEAERSGITDTAVDETLLVHADQGAVERQSSGPESVDIIDIKVPVAEKKREKQPVARIYSTKSERFDALYAELRQSPRPLTVDEKIFLDEYYQEEGGQLYMGLVGDLRTEYGVAERIDAGFGS